MSAAPEVLAGVQSIPLASLRVSDTGAQAERRKRFDKAAIAELAESIRTVGLLQPLVVRPRDDGFQIIAGERRFLAAQAAGLDTVLAAVRELTDDQVLEVQLIENLQREGLHELVEAEGYEALMKRHGYTVDDLVAKVGKSRAYVYARLKLLALCKEGRKAFYDGKISASIALLVARIPGDSLQQEALKEITQGR
jgi:ParB/RepB/Spo0J family partition protein